MNKHKQRLEPELMNFTKIISNLQFLRIKSMSVIIGSLALLMLIGCPTPEPTECLLCSKVEALSSEVELLRSEVEDLHSMFASVSHHAHAEVQESKLERRIKRVQNLILGRMEYELKNNR